MDQPALFKTTSTATEDGSGWLEVVADPVRLQILRALAIVPHATASKLAMASQTSRQTLRRHLEALVTLGVIEEEAGECDGETPGRPASRYSLPSPVRESVRSVLGGPETRSLTYSNAASAPMNGASTT